MHEFTPGPDTARDFRAALGRFATGVTVVTTMTDLGPLGITANSFASVSLDPPLVLWCPAKFSKRYKAFVEADHFAIHVLGTEQEALAQRFAGDGLNFEGADWRHCESGIPILNDCVARFECASHANHDGGDHRIVVGRVIRAAWREGAPMLFHGGAYGMFTNPG